MTPPVETDAGELLGVAEVAKRARVRPQQVNRWIATGVRVGGTRVRLKAAAVYGTRAKVSEADLAAFERECRRAKFGPDAADTVPVETPARRAKRGSEAKARLAAMLSN